MTLTPADPIERSADQHRAIAALFTDQALNAATSGPKEIVTAIAGLTHALLALTAPDVAVVNSIAAPVLTLAATDVPAPPVQPDALYIGSLDGPAVDFDGLDATDRACHGCPARSHEHSWQFHVHHLTACTHYDCPKSAGPVHAHLTRHNIVRYVGSLCTAEECAHAEFEHAHYFTADDPDSPGAPYWLVRER